MFNHDRLHDDPTYKQTPGREMTKELVKQKFRWWFICMFFKID